MCFGTKPASDQLSLMGIPTPRRHLYFYLLLFLGTVVVHNLWKTSQPVPVRSAMEEVHTIVTTAPQLNQ